jgi:hypothetical protein
MLAALLLTTAVVAERGQTPTHDRHLRPMSALAHAIVDDALDRSPTIRHLVDVIEHSDAIVYVDFEYHTPALGVTQIVTSNAYARFISIAIDITLPSDRREEILGHELQHATEIAADPGVRDDAGMQVLFKKIGWSLRDHEFETAAAMSTEMMVRRDLHGAPTKPARSSKNL